MYLVSVYPGQDPSDNSGTTLSGNAGTVLVSTSWPNTVVMVPDRVVHTRPSYRAAQSEPPPPPPTHTHTHAYRSFDVGSHLGFPHCATPLVMPTLREGGREGGREGRGGGGRDSNPAAVEAVAY